MSESPVPQGFPAATDDFPVPIFATATGALPPHYYSDPIVTAPGLGITGWWTRIWTTLRQAWQPLLTIAFVVAIPAAVLDLRVGRDSLRPTPTTSPGTALASVLSSSIFALIFGSVGLGASTWLIVRRAAGRPSGLGGALRHGLRRAAPMIGWQLLYYAGGALATLVILGVSQCVGWVGILLAALVLMIGWLAYAVFGALIRTIVAVRGSDSPIRMSWSLVADNFGAAVGRILLTDVLTIVPTMVVGLSAVIVDRAEPSAVALPTLVVLSAVTTAWGAVIGPVCMLITYAELHARSMPLLATDILDTMEPTPMNWPPRDWSTWSTTSPNVPSQPVVRAATPPEPPTGAPPPGE